jgi:hypothetical protein
MKPKPRTSTPRRKVMTAPTMQSLQTLMNGLRRPFSSPAPDAALHRFGCARPTKPGTQI